MTPLKKSDLNLRYNAPVVPPYLIAFLASLAEQREWRTARWFAGLGIEPAQCVDPDVRLSFRQAITIIRRALADTKEPALGLQVGARETLSSCGVVGFAMMSAPTFGQAMSLVDLYHAMTGSLLDQRIEVRGDKAMLIAIERFPSADVLPFLCEEVFSCALQIATALLGTEAQPLAVEFTYAAPPSVARYVEAFDCPLRFNCPENRILFDASLLSRPLSGADPTTHAAALRLCAKESPQACYVADHVTALELWLRGRIGSRAKITDAARLLHMSERTLRRRLAESGWRFHELQDSVRAQHANRLLADRTRTVTQVADELGFSDSREFRRAFKRWTGIPPRDARERGV